VTNWFVAFSKEPILFLLGAAAVAGTMALGLRLKLIIESRAGQIWANKFDGETVPKWARDATKTKFFRFRTDARLVKWYRAFAREILPTFTIFGSIALLVWWSIKDWRVLVACALVAAAVAVRNAIGRLS
jgi:hypothetical protein